MAFLSLQQLPLPQVTKLWNGAFVNYMKPMGITEDVLQARMKQYAISPEYSTVATIEDEYAGVMLFGLKGNLAWIGGMATLPNYRGYGIGRSLVAHAISLAQSLHVKELRLEVIVGNEKAENLYRSTNFTIINTLAVAKGTLAHYRESPIQLKPTRVNDWHLATQPNSTSWETRLEASDNVHDIYLKEQRLGYICFREEGNGLYIQQFVLLEPTQALVEAVLTGLHTLYGSDSCKVHQMDAESELYGYLQTLGFEELYQQRQMTYQL